MHKICPKCGSEVGFMIMPWTNKLDLYTCLKCGHDEYLRLP